MFLVAVGTCLPLLLGVLPPAVAAVLYALITGELIVEACRPARRETHETLATPTKSVALLLIGGGTIALLKTWPEPARRSATLLLLSGVCLLWGYRHGRTKGPWILAVPCLLITFSMAVAYAGGWAWADRLIGLVWLVSVALTPAALVWSLIVVRRFSMVSACFALGLVYLLMLFCLGDWTAIAAYAFVVMLALVAVRRDPDVPFLPSGLGLGVWLVACLPALAPRGSGIGWLPISVTSLGARALLSAQSILERVFGSHTWEKLWSIPRQVPHISLSDIRPWWQEYLSAQTASLGWQAVILTVALVITLFLICTPSRRPRDNSHPVLWRLLVISAWLVVAMLTNLWLVSPLLWLLMGGVLGLKEAVAEPEAPAGKRGLSHSAALFPAVMAALLVVPLVQSAREWRAEHLTAVQGRSLSAAKWAPWRTDIVQIALEDQLQSSPTQRDDVAIEYLLSWLMRSDRKGVAYNAEAALNAAGGGPALVSLGSAVRSSPRDLKTRRRYADALKASGRREEARRQYEACADLSPMDPSLRIAIGSIWEQLRRDDLALAEYRKALVLDPESNVARLKVAELSSRAVR